MDFVEPVKQKTERKKDATTEALASLESFIDDWRSDLGLVSEQPKASGACTETKKYHARYTAKKELLEIQDYFKRLSGKKMTAGEIIDHALEQLANDIGAHYALDDKED